MTRATRSELLDTCRRLVGRARGAGRRVAVELTERFRGRLAAGRGFLDVYGFQLALADEIEAMRAGLAVWERRYEREVERGGRLRRRRGHLAADVRAMLLGLKESFTGAFDHATADRLLDRVRRLAGAPAEVLDQARGFHATLTDPALELPAPARGVEIDVARVVRSLEAPVERLGETLAELAECEAAKRHAGERRDEALARLAVFAGQVARLYEAFDALAAHERLVEES